MCHMKCSKAAWVRRPNALGGISAYSAVVTLVSKVIIGTAPSAGASVTPRSSQMTTTTRGEKKGRVERMHSADEFVHFVSLK